MRVRSRSFLLLALMLAFAGNAADLLASAAIMACCAKTDFRCAGMKTPDDCCQSMRHAGRQDLATTRTGTETNAHPVAILPEPLVADSIVLDRAPAVAVKRPHDPPHLHYFNLLI